MQRNCKFNWCLDSMTSRMKSYICNLLDSNSGICYYLGLSILSGYYYCSSFLVRYIIKRVPRIMISENKTRLIFST